MAYKDTKLGLLFPTRTGQSIGAAGERKMLDAIDATPNWRTRLRIITDGVKTITTRLRTRGGMPEFITEVEEPEDKEDPVVEMDSGAIDLVSMSTVNDAMYKDGILHYGNDTRLYYALKRLLGKIRVRSLKCKGNPPAELASPKSYLVKPDALGKRDPDMLDLLYLKKLSSAVVPASLFCGKARMYAQAQYGAPLKYWKWAPDIAGGKVPQLNYMGDPRRAITTFSGVYLDDNFTHWLLSMDNLGVRITKLVRDESVKPLVRKLRNPGLPAGEFDKVEAYILSRSYPSETMTFWMAVPGVPGCNSMGYGWKFNWDGTACDIIAHKAVPQTITVDYFEATHYRIKFFRDSNAHTPAGMSALDAEKLRWSAKLSVEEGPILWHNNYTGECIAVPLWGEYVLEKFGTKGGESLGNAPVYCFYKRNDLEVIRYQSNSGGRWFPGTNIPKYKRTTSPSAFHGEHDWSVDNMGAADNFGTIGVDGGTGETRSTTDKPYTAGFVCSSATAVTTTHSYNFDKWTAGTKTFGSRETGSGEYTASVGDIYLNVSTPTYTQGVIATGSDGVPLIGGGSNTATGDTFLGHGYLGIVPSITVQFDTSNTSGTHSEGADVVLIIPFNDAEAVYMRAVKSTTVHETGFSGTMDTMSGNWAYVWIINDTTDGGLTFFEVARGIVYRAHSGTQGYNTNEQAIDTTTNNYEVVCSKLITSAGAFDFNPPESMSPFSDGSTEVVEQTYSTQSSLLGATIGHGAQNLMGFYNFSEPVPFIGWA